MYNGEVVEEFRSTAGTVGGLLSGRDMLPLTTTDAKSGQPRLSRLAYFTIDDKMLIVGSFAGNAVDPGWVHDLRANPRASIESGTGSYDVTARELSRPGRGSAYPQIVDVAPGFADYEKRMERVIPLFELTRN